MSEHRRRRPGQSGSQPPYANSGQPERRPTRAEMRRAAQAQDRGSRRGRRAASPQDGAGAADPRGAGRAAGRRAAGPAKRRLLDYPRAGRYGVRRWLPSWKQLLGVFVLGCGGLTAAVGIAYAMTPIPTANPRLALQNNVYYWNDNSVMASQGAVDRENITLDKVPQQVQWDFLAAENASFYTDSGIDPQGIARAVLHMAEGGQVQSGSTITQQFVKNTYLDQEQTISRKLKELLISVKIGSKLSKQQILTGYLNTCYFGRGANGIEAAARAYYGKDVSQLNVSQGAFLTASVNEPSLYQNADDPKVAQQAKARWSWILDRMVTIGKLTPAQRAKYTVFPAPKAESAGKGMSGQIGYLVQTAEDYVTSHSPVTAKDLSLGGYQIHTTFDHKKVNELAASVAKVRKDNLDPKTRPVDNFVQMGAASVVPGDGAIVALYGGSNYVGHYTNNANTTGVPVGSTFKPFVLASALQHGATLHPGEPPSPITPSTRFNGDDLIKIKQPDGSYVLNKDNSPFRQKNETSHRWGYITLRKAMEQSVNSPFVQLGEYTGLQNVADTAQQAGLLKSTFASLNASFSIGTSTPSAIRMADAYATFADSGTHADPYSVTKVVHNGVNVDGFSKPSATHAMPASVADNVTNVLKGVITKGTATKALATGRKNIAGKTGTTDKNKSAWFVGYSKQLSTSVVLFREKEGDPSLLSMNGVGGQASVFGGALPTEVWTQYMKQALAGQPDAAFPKPGALPKGSDEPGAPDTASPSPTLSASPTPSGTQPTAPSQTPSPTPSESTCTGLFSCGGKGGNGGGNGNGGGSASASPSSSDSTSQAPGLFGSGGGRKGG
jgi:membrane peptidoglycan carboxypeptidase